MTLKTFALTALAFAAALALSGCWTSQKLLLDARRGSEALPNGVYRASKGDPMRVVPQGGGWYAIDDGGETPKAAAEEATPLFLERLSGAGPGMFAFAAGSRECQGKPKTCEGWTYGLISLRGGELRIALPACNATQPLATRWGAVVRSGEGAECVFDNPASLRSALVELAKDKTEFGPVYVRHSP
jgi:hypothetical protein